jgi:hypothetical protein
VGIYAADWLEPGGIGARHNAGWLRLASGEAAANGRPSGKLSVLPNAGGFAALRIEAPEAPVTVSRIEVRYATGEVEELKLSREISAAQPLGPVPIRGNWRKITAIEIARTAKRGATPRIEVWGHHEETRASSAR